MDRRNITFFMIVTDRDLVIADYAVKSYVKVKRLPDISFKLRIYSNWISSENKQHYFPRWRQLDFVEIVENSWQLDHEKPTDPSLWGPFEGCDTIWDRELGVIDTDFHATVDADFEILDARFLPEMLNRLNRDPHLVAMSTDYSPCNPDCFDTYSNELICLNERWHTWFCLYKKEALVCKVSHRYHEEKEHVADTKTIRRNAWDSAGFFQKHLIQSHGFKLDALDPSFQPCFIHYGAFGQNRDINSGNVALYRRLQILRKFTDWGVIGTAVRLVATLCSKVLFGKADKNRSTYADGWGIIGAPADTSH